MKRLAILGSTGSIGRSAMLVIAEHPDQLKVVSLAAGRNVDELASQVQQCKPQVVSLADRDALDAFRATGAADGCVTLCGEEGLRAVTTHPDVDLVLCASSGTAALDAVLAAIEESKVIALANKEVLVMAGQLMVDSARRSGTAILPVDSEHNAIHQCVHGRSADDVERYILTASGGPFRNWSEEQLELATPADALRHPTWEMGQKITIDSATLMNKGLEVIEAHWLFGAEPDRIGVLVHPQSVVHSLVEFRDGSIIAQFGITDMRLPIQYAFSYPERWHSPLPSLDLVTLGSINFLKPDHNRFPSLELAYAALRGGAVLPPVLNAANEVAVSAFLANRLKFMRIPVVIEKTLDAAVGQLFSVPESLSDVRELDAWARSFSETVVGQ